MPFLVIHNGDDQGQNFAGGVGQIAAVVGVIQAQFVAADIAPATFAAVQVLVTQHGPLNLVWAGHGAGNNQRGTPLTNQARRIRARNFQRLFQIMRPTIVIFFSCKVGRWIERNAHGLLPLYGPHRIHLRMYGYRTPIHGMVRHHTYGYLRGQQASPLPVTGNLVQTEIGSHVLRQGPHPGLGIQNRVRLRGGLVHSFSPAGFHEV